MKKIHTIDAFIEVYFLTQNEGGRKTSICGEKYNCPLIARNRAFDCRFALDTFCFELGKRYKIPIAFLNAAEAKKYIQNEENIYLWEGKKIGVGKLKWND
jgi:hypothetical protein